MKNESKDNESFTVVEFKPQNGNGMRYAICDADGKIIDDAQGYGYKSKQNAHKALWYRQNKSNIEKWKSEAKNIISNHKHIFEQHKWILEDFGFVKDGMTPSEISGMFWERIRLEDEELYNSIDKRQRKSIELELLS